MDNQESTKKNSTCFQLLPSVILTFLIWTGLFIIFGMRCTMDIVQIDAKDFRITITDDIRNKINSFPFWGYLVAQIPGGFLAMKYSAKKLLGGAIVSSCLLFLFVPVSLIYYPPLTKFIRFSQGLTEGIILPSCYSIWAYCIPISLRTTMVTLAFSGCYLGILIGRLLVAQLIEYLSWQSPFYIYGCFGVIWFALWICVISKRSQKCLNGNAHELFGNTRDSSGQQTVTMSTIPWKAFISSGPIWAFFTANFCKFWFFFVVNYVGDVYSIVSPEINKDLVFKKMQVIMVMAVIVAGVAADCLRRCITTTIVRKLFCSGPFLIEAFASIVAVYTSDISIAVYSTYISIVANGISISGFNVNLLDIAPKNACILIGFSNTIGIIASCAYFLVDYHILYGKTDWRYEWNLLYLVAALWHTLAAIVYILIGSGEVQSWAAITQSKEQQRRHTEESTGMVESSTDSPRTV